MIDADSRTLRIRVTGRAQSAKGPVTRSVIAALKRDSFLDFLWFTDYETSDPVWYSVRSNGRPTGGPQGDLLTWAANNCPEYYRYAVEPRQQELGRQVHRRQLVLSGQRELRQHRLHHRRQAARGRCTPTTSCCACGTPTFGRNAQDRIESGNGWRSGGCSGVPNFQGTLIPDLGHDRHAGHQRLAGHGGAAGGYTFTGPTTITFGTAPGKITVTNLPTYNNTQMAYPSNGVIYVKASGSCPLYSALYPSYSSRTRCPAAAQRLRLRRREDQRHLRHRPDDRDPERPHRHRRRHPRPGRRRHARPHRRRLRARRARHQRLRPLHAAQRPHLQQHGHAATGAIDAAILTLLHSVTVDRYYCGNPIGKLTINGMIAQKFRGAVGKNSGGSVRPRLPQELRRTTRGWPSARRRTSSIP